MRNINAGNTVIIAAVVIVTLVILGFIGTLLSNIIPLTIVAIVAFILGRMSHTVNYFEMARRLLKRVTAERSKTAQTVVQPKAAAQTSEASAVKPAASVTQAAPAETEAPDQDQKVEAATANLSDFEIKSEEQILTEARLKEEEIRKRSTEYDAMAALEERKKRLLGDQTNQQSNE